jgi:hypothetical protein
MGRADPHGSGWVGLRAGLGWRFGQPEPARVGLRYSTTQPANPQAGPTRAGFAKNPRARTKYNI